MNNIFYKIARFGGSLACFLIMVLPIGFAFKLYAMAIEMEEWRQWKFLIPIACLQFFCILCFMIHLGMENKHGDT